MKDTFDLAEKARQILRLEKNLASIKKKIVVLSGKGGVGKTTVSVRLAKSLAAKGFKTGILDTDIHGPNVSLMLGIEGERLTGNEDNIIKPIETPEGILVVSIANLLPKSDTPVIWRGPAKLTVIRQFLADTEWGPLDYLVIDSPPGTGDEPLTIAKLIHNLDGAIIVTTPQEVSLLDCRKCINFTRQLNLPVLGVIENMSGLKCPHCGEAIELFGKGGGKRMAEEMIVPFLGSIPIEPGTAELADHGKTNLRSDSEVAKAFDGIVQKILESFTD